MCIKKTLSVLTYVYQKAVICIKELYIPPDVICIKTCSKCSTYDIFGSYRVYKGCLTLIDYNHTDYLGSIICHLGYLGSTLLFTYTCVPCTPPALPWSVLP